MKEPSEPGSAVLLGFSYLRLILILVVLFLLLGILILLFDLFKNSRQARPLFVRLSNQKGIFWIVLLWMAISYVLLFLSDQRLGLLGSYRERLLPILIWLAVLSVQFGFVLLYLRGMNPAVLREQRPLLFGSFVILILFGLFLLAIYLTRIGLTPDNVYWQGSGAPILLHQVFLAIFAAILFSWLIEHTRLGRSNRLDLVIFLVLWGLACLVWLNQPARLTYFSLEPGEPNFQSYPFSDALIYDSTSQEFLIGKPIPGDLWVKPIYSLFLALLHLFAGENYALLTSMQVIVLAIIPSFIYLITTHLDQRLAGLMAAFFMIIRERNAMVLSDIIQVSHSKLLLSDVFAMGEMVLLVWLVLWWLQQPVQRRAAPIAVGGMLGLLILTRGHPVLMIPFLFLVVFIVLKPNIKLWYESSVRIILGLLLVLIPWFWHTYQLTGKLTFQDPSSPYALNDTLVKLYTESSNSGTGQVSEGSSSYEVFQSQAFKSLIEQPIDVAYFTSAHYFHNAIFSYTYLPASFQIEDLNAYVKRLPFWSRLWDGSMPAETWILALLNFVVLSLGISAAWKKVNRLLFVPLILGMGYNLSIAVARRSGWRFILPADWVTLVFYAIGLAQLILIVQAVALQQLEQPDSAAAHRLSQLGSPKQSLVLFGLPFFIIALGLISGHGLFPSRYPTTSPQELLQEYQSALPATSDTELLSLKNFLRQDRATVVYGKALYPIYLKANEGMVNFNWPSFAPQPYHRLAFYLIGPQSMSVNLSIESPLLHFPDGSTVIVIGCKSEAGDINALSVLIQGDSPIYYNSETPSTTACASSGSD
ncbi:MAG: hypothetical protein ACXW4E_02590 [Anaerolineales bacterium]